MRNGKFFRLVIANLNMLNNYRPEGRIDIKTIQKATKAYNEMATGIYYAIKIHQADAAPMSLAEMKMGVQLGDETLSAIVSVKASLESKTNPMDLSLKMDIVEALNDLEQAINKFKDAVKSYLSIFQLIKDFEETDAKGLMEELDFEPSPIVQRPDMEKS